MLGNPFDLASVTSPRKPGAEYTSRLETRNENPRKVQPDPTSRIAEDGSIPFREWFDRLHAQAAAKVVAAVLRMELGNTSNVKWFDGVGEYRINWGPGYRIYLMQDGDRLILLFTGGTKASQKADIKRATKLRNDYRARKSRTKKAK